MLPKPRFYEYFTIVLQSLAEIGKPDQQLTALEIVLINEHCLVIHEMVKEVHQWIQRADQLKKGSQAAMLDQLPKDNDELRGRH